MNASKYLRVTCALLAGLMLAGCTGGAGGTETTPETDSLTAAATEAPTALPTETPTEPETTLRRTETEVELYGNGYTNNLLVGFSEQGRSIPAVAGLREDKDRQVGIFYHTWHGQHNLSGIYHIPTIRELYGDDVLFYQDVPESPAGEFHYWGTPLYGYYYSTDEWIIRRHLEMLTEAGVDFLCFDTTNGHIYKQVSMRIMKVITELRAEGWDAPPGHLVHPQSFGGDGGADL